MADAIIHQSGIYQIRNITNGKRYIGSAFKIRARFSQHRKELQRGTHHSTKLQHAWNKYGSDAFTFEVVEAVAERALLIPREQHWIDHYSSYSDNGYNICPRAGSNLGVKMSDAARAKLSSIAKNQSTEKRAQISKTLTGRKRAPETVAKMRMYKPSADAIKKVAEKRRGSKASPETRKKMSASGRVAWMSRANRSMSAETKLALYNANKGREFSAEHKAKLSSARVGKKHSAATIAKLTGRAVTEEFRARMRVVAKEREASKRAQRIE